MCYTLFLENIPQDLLLGLSIPILLAILGATYYFFRKRISNWWFGRKVQPKLNKALELYEKEILPDYVTEKPKIIPIEKSSEIPPTLAFGYIFIPKGEEELIWETLIAYLPVTSSLRRIRILFDKDLRESLFDVLSYQLGLKLGKEEIAIKFRDLALEKHGTDFEAIEKIYLDGKLTTIILWEASVRYRNANGQISVSDVKEFSTLVRKIAEIDAVVIRVGEESVTQYVDEIFRIGRGVVLLARGKYISKAVDIANQLRGANYELYSSEELGFSNPEIGTWYFETTKKTASFMRVWLKKVKLTT